VKSWCTVTCLALVIAAFGSGGDAQTRTRILFDTDIGTDIDDAWTLAYVMKSPVFDLLGVSVSDGDTALRAKLACKLLHRLGRTNVPVAVGRKTALIPPDRVDYQLTWAEDFDAMKPIAQPASAFLAETIRRHPREVTLVAVGPLHNIGDLVRLHPDAARLLKRVVIMSGSIAYSAWDPGPVAEWNVKLAIDEARAVYAAGLPLTIVPLDSTTYVTLEQSEREELRSRATATTVALEALYRLWIDGPSNKMTLHDQLAVAEAEQPGAFFGRCEAMPLRVDEAGFIRVDRAAGTPVAVCLEPKRDSFMRHYLTTLAQ
jgi:purine nucleosidase